MIATNLGSRLSWQRGFEVLNNTAKQERQEVARKRLLQLRDRGFRFVTTVDDGTTWVAAESPGLEIDGLIKSGFIGDIRMDGCLVSE